MCMCAVCACVSAHQVHAVHYALRVSVCAHVCVGARMCVCVFETSVSGYTQLLAVFTCMRVHHCSVIVKICKINMILFKILLSLLVSVRSVMLTKALCFTKHTQKIYISVHKLN